MTKKTIDTLVEDIYAVFTDPNHKVDQKNLNALGESVKSVVLQKIEEAVKPRKPELRMSIIGKQDRQLWYELKKAETDKVVAAGDVDIYEPNPHKYLMFLFGDIVEALLVFLVREAGHDLKFEQEELEIDGIVGHTDGVIDGVPVDFKTASGYSFRQKFSGKNLLRKEPEYDPFGYKGQLSAYREALLEKHPGEINEEEVAWVAFNKETGEINLLKADVFDLINAEERINQIQNILEKDDPPEEKCYPDQPVSKTDKSGNRVLNKNCTYCVFKNECWANANEGLGLRKYLYSNGVKYFTHVEKLPKVEEVFNV